MHLPKSNEKTTCILPVQQLNGHERVPNIDLWDAGTSALDGATPHRSFLQRACVGMVGALLATNSEVQTLRLNPGSGAEGGGVLEHLNVAQRSTLHTLDLSQIGLGERGGPRLCELLTQGLCANITTLKLGHNRLTDSGIGQPLVQLLSSETCSLTALDLSHNEVSGAVLGRAVRTNSSLTSLDFRHNPVDDNALWVIGGLLLDEECSCRLGYLRSYAFEVVDGATTLSLRDQSLAIGAARLLIGVIKFNSSITDLDLSGCGLVLQASQTLAKAISANTSLTKLDLSRNPLSDISKYSDTELEWSGSGFRQLSSAVSASPVPPSPSPQSSQAVSLVTGAHVYLAAVIVYFGRVRSATARHQGRAWCDRQST